MPERHFSGMAKPHDRYAPSAHAAARKYPMYVLPLDKVLLLDQIRSHEQLREDLVEVPQAHTMTILFCSHTWLRFAHPDDTENSKLKLLQTVLKRALAGDLQVNAHWLTEINGLGNSRIPASELQRSLKSAFCWFDYWSVPQSPDAQHEQALAIESIVSYVGDSQYFFVLAGAWTHENGSLRDVRAWQGRGWCKMEQLAEVLAGSNRPIVCESPSATYISGFLVQEAWMAAPVGLQNFTVASDAKKLGPVISALLDARMERAQASGEVLWLRCMRALRGWILAGTGVTDRDATLSLDEWLSAMGFASIRDGADSGNTPLRFAVYAGRLDLAKELIARGADVEAPFRRNLKQPIMQAKGQTILFSAATTRPNASMIKLLLEARANIWHRANGLSVLDYCCAGGHIENIEALIEAAPALVHKQAMTGNTPLQQLIGFGHPGALEHFLAKHPEGFEKGLMGVGCPWNACQSAVFAAGSVPVIKLLLEHGFDHERVGTWQDMNGFNRTLTLVGRWSRRFGLDKSSAKIQWIYFSSVTTALHAAAFSGNLGAVDLLLEHGADACSTRHYFLRCPPLTLAAHKGHERVAMRLVQAAPAAANMRDSVHRRTPAQWAARGGHAVLAERLEEVARAHPSALLTGAAPERRRDRSARVQPF